MPWTITTIGKPGGLVVDDEGFVLGTADEMDFINPGVDVNVVNGKATVNVAGDAGTIQMSKDGTIMGNASILNFVGNGLDSIGGGIARILSPQITDRLVRVSPDFMAQSDLNQFPTIAQGIAAAVALKAGGMPLVGVLVEPGPYNEYDLIVPDGIVLGFRPGACLAPAAPAGQYLGSHFDIRMEGVSYLIGFRSYRAPVAESGGGYALVFAPSFEGYVDGVVLESPHESYSWDGWFRFEKRTVPWPRIPEQEGIRIDNVRVNAPGVDYPIHMVGAYPNEQTVTFNNCIFEAPRTDISAFITYEGGPSTYSALSGWGNLRFRNCSFAARFISGASLVLGERAGVEFTNCAGLPLSSTKVAITGSPANWRDRIFLSGGDMSSQNWVLPYGESKSTIEEGMMLAGGMQRDLSSMSSDVALLAAQVNSLNSFQSEPYDGMGVWDFAEVGDVFNNGQNGAKFNSTSMQVDINGDWVADSFDAYADSPALNAVWSLSVGAFGVLTLQATGGYDDGKFMRLTQSPGPGNPSTYVRRTVTPPAYSALQGFTSLKYRWKASGNFGTGARFRSCLMDSSGTRFIYGPWHTITYSGSWAEVTITRQEYLRSDPAFDWNSFTTVRFNIDTAGSPYLGVLDIDGLEIIQDEPWTRSALITSFDSLVADGWSGTQGSGDAFDGSGYVTKNIPAKSYFIVTSKTMPAGTYFTQITDATVAVRAMARIKNWTSSLLTGGTFHLTLTDSANQNAMFYGAQYSAGASEGYIDAGLSPGEMSGNMQWKSILFCMSDAVIGSSHWTDPPAAFNFNQVKTITLAFSVYGSLVGYDVDLDLLEAGTPGVLETSSIAIPGKTANQMMLHIPSYGYRSLHMDISGVGLSTSRWKWSSYVAKNTFLGMFKWDANRNYSHGSPVPPGELDGFEGSWLRCNGLVIGSTFYLRARVVTRSRVSVAGVSALFRSVPSL